MKHKTFKGENCDKNKLTTPWTFKIPHFVPCPPFFILHFSLTKKHKNLLEYKEIFKIFHSFLKSFKKSQGGGAGWRNFFLKIQGVSRNITIDERNFVFELSIYLWQSVFNTSVYMMLLQSKQTLQSTDTY